MSEGPLQVTTYEDGLPDTDSFVTDGVDVTYWVEGTQAYFYGFAAEWDFRTDERMVTAYKIGGQVRNQQFTPSEIHSSNYGQCTVQSSGAVSYGGHCLPLLVRSFILSSRMLAHPPLIVIVSSICRLPSLSLPLYPYPLPSLSTENLSA